MPIKKIKSKKPKVKKPKGKTKPKPKQNIILKQIEDAYNKKIISSIPRYEDIQRAGSNYIVSQPPQQIFAGKGTLPEGISNQKLEDYYTALIFNNQKITKKDFEKMNPEEKEAYTYTLGETLGQEAELTFKKKMGLLTKQEKKILKENEKFDKMVSSILKEENQNKNPLSKTPFIDVPQKLKTPKNDYIVLDNITRDDENLNNLQTGKEMKKKNPLSKTPFYDVPQKLTRPTNDYILLDNIHKDDENLNNLEDY